MRNPFPGLRPFDDNPADTEVFFGRDGQVDDLLARLHRQRFVAVVGESGCGKSSLVRAGLLPALRGGFLAGAGSRWRIGVMRPGGSPTASLAQALDLPQDVLESGSLGLVQAVQNAHLRDDENVLLIVDQFEELFRFRHAGSSAHASDEAAAFVKLILSAAGHRDVPVYVLITMRSDFIGECARFRELPETLNEGLYLVPRLTRDQLREVIEGPVHMREATIEPRLVNRILNDLGDDPDQLPLLQVALMCTWNHWEARNKPGEPIGLEDYEAVGGLADALSQQGDEILRGLPERERAVSARMFKALTDSGSDNRGIRRPLDFAALWPVAGGSEEEVRKVVDVWRAPGVSFLMPPAGTPIDSGTVIDLSHEALMRAWGTLRGWVSDEAESAKLYRRLLEGAQMHDRGRGMLLADPTLKFAEEWRDEERPTDAWAARYGGGLASVLALIRNSRRAVDTEVERNLRAQRRTRTVAVVMSIVALLALGGLAYAAFEGHRAKVAEADATAKASEARLAEQKAVVAQRGLQAALAQAKSEAKIAQEQAKIAQQQTRLAKAAQLRQQQMAMAARETSRRDAAEAGSALLARVDDDLYAAKYSDYRVLGLVGVNSYALNPSVEAREQLLEAAYTPGSLARTALPPWNLGAVSGRGSYVTVLAGAQQSRYGAPISGVLVSADAASLSLLSRGPRATATMMCGFTLNSRIVLATGTHLELYDPAASGIPRVGSFASGPVAALACAPDSETAYYVDAGGILRSADMRGGMRHIVGSAGGGVNGLTLSPGGRYGAVTSSDGKVGIFDLRERRRVSGGKIFNDERHDCLAGGCGGAVTFDATEKILAWYDGGRVYTASITGKDQSSHLCAPTLCDHPTLIYPSNFDLPEVLAETAAECCGNHHQYVNTYGKSRTAPHRALYDSELGLFITPYDPAAVDEPNPLGGGLAEHGLAREDAPMVGRIDASGFYGAYAVRRNEVLLPGQKSFLVYDLDRLRHSLVNARAPSNSIKLRGSGDGAHAVSFDYDTGRVRVLDIRPETPVVLHEFFVAPIPKNKSGYEDVVRIAYDPRTGAVTLASKESLKRYTSDGRQLSSQSMPELLRKAKISKLSYVRLSARGNYVGIQGTESAGLFKPDGTWLATYRSIDAISDDERYLFVFESSGGNGTETIVELPSLVSVGITAIPDSALHLALSPDGRTIAYDDPKGQYKDIRLYDVRSRTSYRFGLPQPPFLDTYREIAFSFDGRYVLVTYDNTYGSTWLAVYSVDPQTWARTACLEAGRPLNASEFRAIAGSNAPFVDGCAPFESQMYRW